MCPVPPSLSSHVCVGHHWILLFLSQTVISKGPQLQLIHFWQKRKIKTCLRTVFVFYKPVMTCKTVLNCFNWRALWGMRTDCRLLVADLGVLAIISSLNVEIRSMCLFWRKENPKDTHWAIALRLDSRYSETVGMSCLAVSSSRSHSNT